jgi:hypothetical protein
MNLLTRTELAHRSKFDLDALFALVLQEITRAEHGSPEWHGAMISLDNIRYEQAARRVIVKPQPPRGPGF